MHPRQEVRKSCAKQFHPFSAAEELICVTFELTDRRNYQSGAQREKKV